MTGWTDGRRRSPPPTIPIHVTLYRAAAAAAAAAAASSTPLESGSSTEITRFDSHTPFNGPFSGTTRVGRYQKGKTNLDFTEARDSEWQWHQLGHMQVCTLL